jgi:hypothetical protein
MAMAMPIKAQPVASGRSRAKVMILSRILKPMVQIPAVATCLRRLYQKIGRVAAPLDTAAVGT